MITMTDIAKWSLFSVSVVWLMAAFTNPFCWMSGTPQGYVCVLGWLPSIYPGLSEAWQIGGVSLLAAVLAEQIKRTGWWTGFALCVAHLAIAAGLVVSLMYVNPHLSKLQIGITFPMLISTIVILRIRNSELTIQKKNQAVKSTISALLMRRQPTSHRSRD